MTSVHFQGKPFNITVIQVYVPTSNAEEAEVEHAAVDVVRGTAWWEPGGAGLQPEGGPGIS